MKLNLLRKKHRFYNMKNMCNAQQFNGLSNIFRLTQIDQIAGLTFTDRILLSPNIWMPHGELRNKQKI